MTRKKYSNDNYRKHSTVEITQSMERELQAEFEEEQRQELASEETFAFQNFNKLYEIYQEISYDVLFFSNCAFEDFCDFVEHPSECDDLMRDLDEYELEMWHDEHKLEVSAYFNVLRKYIFIQKQECTYRQWAVFCYCINH